MLDRFNSVDFDEIEKKFFGQAEFYRPRSRI